MNNAVIEEIVLVRATMHSFHHCLGMGTAYRAGPFLGLE